MSKKKKNKKKKNNKVRLGIILGILIIVLWFFILFDFDKFKQPEFSFLGEEEKNEEIIDEEEIISSEKEPINFKDYSLKREERNIPISVIIDNFSQSWPNSGINQAAIVYEAPVEADITRFLVIYELDSLPDKIGPVRSARPYFAEWADEYQGLFIHAGGSPEFLEKADSYEFFNLDEISYNGSYFYREKSKDRPHNLYIEEESILNSLEDKKINKEIRPDFNYWSFNSEKSFEDSSVNLIVKIGYREPVVWQYDSKTETYLRFQNDQPFLDEQGEQIRTRNIVIQKTEIEVLDSVGRRFIRTEGEGEAVFFQKGSLIEGFWENNGDRTTFYNKKDQEIDFLPGSIWIEVVSSNHEVIY